MSFGYSISDFVLLTKLASDIVQNSREACGAHKDLTSEVNSLHIVLRRLESEVSKPDSILNRNDRRNGDMDIDRRDELAYLCRVCYRILGKLSRILKKYPALLEEKRSVTRLWQSVKFGNREMPKLAVIRQRLLTCTCLLGMYVNFLSTGSNGKIEAMLQSRGEESKKMMRSLNWIVASMQAKSTSREDSVLTTYHGDEKRIWKEFRRELLSEGFSSNFLNMHKETIKQYVLELGSRGALDEVEEEVEEVIEIERGRDIQDNVEQPGISLGNSDGYESEDEPTTSDRSESDKEESSDGYESEDEPTTSDRSESDKEESSDGYESEDEPTTSDWSESDKEESSDESGREMESTKMEVMSHDGHGKQRIKRKHQTKIRLPELEISSRIARKPDSLANIGQEVPNEQLVLFKEPHNSVQEADANHQTRQQNNVCFLYDTRIKDSGSQQGTVSEGMESTYLNEISSTTSIWKRRRDTITLAAKENIRNSLYDSLPGVLEDSQVIRLQDFYDSDIFEKALYPTWLRDCLVLSNRFAMSSQVRKFLEGREDLINMLPTWFLEFCTQEDSDNVEGPSTIRLYSSWETWSLIHGTPIKFIPLWRWMFGTARVYDSLVKILPNVASMVTPAVNELQLLLFRACGYNLRVCQVLAQFRRLGSLFEDQLPLRSFVRRFEGIMSVFRRFIEELLAHVSSMKKIHSGFELSEGLSRTHGSLTSQLSWQELMLQKRAMQYLRRSAQKRPKDCIKAIHDFVYGLYQHEHLIQWDFFFSGASSLAILVRRIQDAVLYFKETCEDIVLQREGRKEEPLEYKHPHNLSLYYTCYHDLLEEDVRDCNTAFQESRQALEVWKANAFKSYLEPFHLCSEPPLSILLDNRDDAREKLRYSQGRLEFTQRREP